MDAASQNSTIENTLRLNLLVLAGSRTQSQSEQGKNHDSTQQYNAIF